MQELTIRSESIQRMYSFYREKKLRHHRTIVSAAFAQSFAPSVQG